MATIACPLGVLVPALLWLLESLVLAGGSTATLCAGSVIVSL